jgi:hypothetical protein
MANIPLRPLGTRFYGVWIGYPPGVIFNPWEDFTNGLNFWTAHANLIKTIGANCAAIIMTPESVVTSVISRSTYHSRIHSVLNMFASKGIFVLPYASQNFGARPSSDDAAMMNEVVASIAIMPQHPNVIGALTKDEPWGGGDVPSFRTTTEITNWVNSCYSACRAVLPAEFPISIADPCGDYNDNRTWSTTGTPGTKLSAVVGSCDFIALHMIDWAGTPSDYTTLKSTYSAKDFIFPSMGVVDGAGNQASCRNAAGTIMGQSNNRGGIFFSAMDWTGASYGIFNNDNSERTTSTNPFKSAVVETYPKHPNRFYSGKPRLTAMQRWGYR